MDYLPLFIRTQGQPCLIAGGGEVALRKARMLLKAGAELTVIAPAAHPELEALAAKQQLQLRQAEFAPDADISAYRLIIAATDDKALNTRIAATAEAAGIFCNVVDDAELSTAIVPAIIDRSPVVVAVSSGGRSPVMATRVRQQIERLLPTALGRLADFAGSQRQTVKQRFSHINQRRHFWQRILDGNVAAHALKGDMESATQLFAQELQQTNTEENNKQVGYAWIVGAGPGDPELLTLKAARVLANADTILHDRLVSPAVLELARRDANYISVGKQAGKPSISQADINALLIEHVKRGEHVCRLKGGDPFIFGRGGEEIEALEAAGLPWEVVPGITAASGSAAATGIPLTHRETSRGLSLVTASTADDAATDWARFAIPNHTLVVYMAVSKLAEVSSGLIDGGLPENHPVVIIENGTTDRQRMLRGTLADISHKAIEAAIGSPAILLTGEVASLNTVLQSALPAEPMHDGWSAAAHN